MIYPGTDQASVGMGNSGGDAKKRLIQMLSKKGALPLFGGQGRNANDLPSVGAPAINFNPFLKMLAGRPGETFQDLPQGIDGALASGIQNGPGPVQGGGAEGDPNNAGYNGSSVPTTGGGSPYGSLAAPNPTQPSPGNDYSAGFGHYNDTRAPSNGAAPPQQAGGGGFGANPSIGTAASGLNLAGLDPATAFFLLHLSGGLQGYNQDR